MSYTVRTLQPGRHCVSYTCGRCLTPLESPLSEAGTQQQCPDCGEKFVTPGMKEWEEHQQREAEAKRRAAQAKQRDAEAKRREAADRERARQNLWERQRKAEVEATVDFGSPAPVDRGGTLGHPRQHIQSSDAKRQVVLWEVRSLTCWKPP
jgi:uncharacterized Zn finger protein (UPF0148 family)